MNMFDAVMMFFLGFYIGIGLMLIFNNWVMKKMDAHYLKQLSAIRLLENRLMEFHIQCSWE